MDSKEYEVEVVYRQRAIYRVEAADREEAERLAVERWQEGEPSVLEGYDWGELEAIHAHEAPELKQVEQDSQLVLRFLRERERLILRLGGNGLQNPGNDAISASQIASDLGWSRRERDGLPRPDALRATVALERLCRARKVVCFQRPRVRTGERGEIRLYCTPEYLEQLSMTMETRQRQVV